MPSGPIFSCRDDIASDKVLSKVTLPLIETKDIASGLANHSKRISPTGTLKAINGPVS